MVIKFIVKLIKIYNVIKFDKEDNLSIIYNGSKITLNKKGDIIINSKRHTIHHRDLFFDGCDEEFISSSIIENEKGKKNLENYIMSNYINKKEEEEEKEEDKELILSSNNKNKKYKHHSKYANK